MEELLAGNYSSKLMEKLNRCSKRLSCLVKMVRNATIITDTKTTIYGRTMERNPELVRHLLYIYIYI